MPSLKLASFWIFGQFIPFLSAVILLTICNSASNIILTVMALYAATDDMPCASCVRVA